MSKITLTVDGNEATARIAHKVSEVIAIYPITPSSPMGELADAFSAEGKTNLWGVVPKVVEMQSEGGASGAIHGATQTGSLATTFTASQGLLLMIPNMHKIAGELSPAVIHVAARTVATHALSIFGDHSDVMDTRATGFALLASGSVQEAHDLALIAHASTLITRIPFLHFFDGFRTSHEVQKIQGIPDEVIQAMMDEEAIKAHRQRALSPDHPFIRGTAQNPDHFFQARESCNAFYFACPDKVAKVMERFAQLTGRSYHLFDYVGAEDAERVVILMGSGAETAHETIEALLRMGEKVGVIKVRLYRPFSRKHLFQVLPRTVRKVAVLDRTKEPGSSGEPLYLDIVNAFVEGVREGEYPHLPVVVGGRYGLSSKEFTPAMVKGVLDELKKDNPKNHFTIGIHDDVTLTSLSFDESFSTEEPETFRGHFYGLGADGTVSANKNSIKIIGENTPFYAQGYFVYDSKKAGAMTISHLRFGKKPLRSTYLIKKANFVACHQWVFLNKLDVLEALEEGGTFLLNSPYGPEEVWDQLPREVQQDLIHKKAKFYCIDAYKVAKETGMGSRINTIMQTCFFKLANILPIDQAIQAIKDAIVKTYGKKGEGVVKQNFEAVDRALENLHEVKYPLEVTSTRTRELPVPPDAPPYVQEVAALIMLGKGDTIPVSKFPPDGTFPSGTAQYEKRNIALEIPIWEKALCIACGKCAIVCPHAAIRTKAYPSRYLEDAPIGFEAIPYKGKEFPEDYVYTVQVAPEDCTGCTLCVEICPAKDKENPDIKAINMKSHLEYKDREKVKFDYFMKIPDLDRTKVKITTVKGSQLLRPLFEFSGACTGCGETPYIKLATQLFGDRMIIANATGCSSIYGGNLPTTPYTFDAFHRGPAWNNSLFEDAAEFGFGFRLALNQLNEQARYYLKQLASFLGESLVEEMLHADQSTEEGIQKQRDRVSLLKKKLQELKDPQAKQLLVLADYLVKKSVWIVGGDGWAYDIGYGGLDHVIAQQEDVNILVLDTEVYSNTGGQQSKATPMGAIAKFASGGKPTPKKDLGLLAMAYGHAYVARVALGASDQQALRVFLEAESYPGPSLMIAYSHCIEHGYTMGEGLEHQKLAVQAGIWPTFRFDPRRFETGENPLKLDVRAIKEDPKAYLRRENRFRRLMDTDPEKAAWIQERFEKDVHFRFKLYQYLSQMDCSS